MVLLLPVPYSCGQDQFNTREVYPSCVWCGIWRLGMGSVGSVLPLGYLHCEGLTRELGYRSSGKRGLS